MEKLEHVRVTPGDDILLYTGRWKRRAAVGPWPNTTGFAGYHADVAYFLKERGVSFIGCDGPNDVSPTGFPPTVTNPLHRLALVAMGVSIFDNLDFERAVEHARKVNRYEFLVLYFWKIAFGTNAWIPLTPSTAWVTTKSIVALSNM
jgi:kynurenine formamidase